MPNKLKISQDHSENCDGSDDKILHTNSNSTSRKHCAIWDTAAISILLKLYENKLQILETPRKKTQIWISISDDLKEYNIDMTPDQVRWKIYALHKKYKQCLDNGRHDKFKYFKAINNINYQYNLHSNSKTTAKFLCNMKLPQYRHQRFNIIPSNYWQEMNTTIEMRKMRLANRIECDISQGKIQLEKQWLECLRKKEKEKQQQDVIYERTIKLQEQELELRKKGLELKQTFEQKMIQLLAKDIDNMKQIEEEKCYLLKEILNKSKPTQ